MSKTFLWVRLVDGKLDNIIRFHYYVILKEKARPSHHK